jgi:predicted permease
MRRLRAWLLRLVGTFCGGRRERDLDDELEGHLQLHIADNIRAGMPPDQARRQAILALGGVEQVKEKYRERYAFPTLTHLIQDTRYGMRTLRKSRGFAVAAIATLGLGLGANMAIFRFVDAVLLKSLPVENPEELVLVRPWASSYPAFREFAARNVDVLASTAARWTIAVNLTADGTTELMPAELVSGSYFGTLRVKPAVGRLLTPEDDGAEGAHPVCVISYGLWQRRFAGDAAVVGRFIELNATPFEIVGITHRGFNGADLHARHDVQIPMSMTYLFAGMERDSSSWAWLTMFGRLAPGVAREQAEVVVRARFQPRFDWQKRTPLFLSDGRQGAGSLKTQFEDPVLIAQLLSACVFLIACANLASLLLAKTSARRHELAIRRSLGASRGRLMSQLIVESFLLASAGAALGTGLAVLLDRVLAAMLAAPGSNLNLTAVPSALGLTVSFGLGVVAALAIGVLPALIAAGDAPLDGLRDTPRTGPRSGWLGRGLVVTQVVVCLVLVFAAGLFARSLHNLRTIDLGLDPRHVAVLTANPERSGYSMERTREFYAEWLRRARHVPGVSSVSLASITAMSGAMFAGAVTVPDAEPRSGPEPNNNFNVVTADYFQTVGMPLLAGRTFTERDDAKAPAVAVVNERFVEHYWPGRSPIGRPITVFRKSVEIVGLVRTAKYTAVREDPQITIYFPAAQRPVRELTLHARVVGSTAAATAALMETVRGIDPRVPVYNVGVLEDHVNARLANERVLYVLSMLFASLALLVACAGLYGLVAYSVVRRTREVGIRLAVGAQRGQILRLFVKDAVVLVGTGIALGIPLSFVAGRQFSTVLYGLDPSSVSTLLVASSILATVAAVAAGFPAAKATRVDPVVALREQ